VCQDHYKELYSKKNRQHSKLEENYRQLKARMMGGGRGNVAGGVPGNVAGGVPGNAINRPALGNGQAKAN